MANDVHKFSESPILDGKSSYIVALAANFLFKGIGSHWTVSLDGVADEKDYSLVAVCNGRYYGGGFMPVAEARMDDGVLNTLVVDKVSRMTFLKFVGHYSKGELRPLPPSGALLHCQGHHHLPPRKRTSPPVWTASASPPTMCTSVWRTKS